MCFIYFCQVDFLDQFPLFSMFFAERPINFALEVLAALKECALKIEMSIPSNPKILLTQRATVTVETGIYDSM